MYTVVKEPIAWIDVDWQTLEIGSPEEGSVQAYRSIRMKVKLIGRSELLAMLEGTTSKTVEEIAREVSRDWAGVVDEDKRPVPFSIEILAQILEHEPGFASGFEIAFTKACVGQGKVRTGNSSASPADGQGGEAKPKSKPARKSS